MSLSRGLLLDFKGYQLCQVPPDQNTLAKLAIDPEIEQYRLVSIGYLETPSIDK